jgi:hypothetical protein
MKYKNKLETVAPYDIAEGEPFLLYSTRERLKKLSSKTDIAINVMINEALDLWEERQVPQTKDVTGQKYKYSPEDLVMKGNDNLHIVSQPPPPFLLNAGREELIELAKEVSKIIGKKGEYRCW